jgi:hypothetical protein
MGDDRVKWYRKILLEDPTSRIFVELAEVLYSQGHFQEVIEVCRQGLKLHPTNKRARVMLGLALWREGDSLESERELTIVQKDLEKNAPIYKVLAEIRWQKGQPGHACRLLDTYLHLQPEDMEARSLRHQWEDQIRNPPIPPDTEETEGQGEPGIIEDLTGQSAPVEPASVEEQGTAPAHASEPDSEIVEFPGPTDTIEQSGPPEATEFAESAFEPSPEAIAPPSIAEQIEPVAPGHEIEKEISIEPPPELGPNQQQAWVSESEMAAYTMPADQQAAAEPVERAPLPAEEPEPLEQDAPKPDLVGALEQWWDQLGGRKRPSGSPRPILDQDQRSIVKNILTTAATTR